MSLDSNLVVSVTLNDLNNLIKFNEELRKQLRSPARLRFDEAREKWAFDVEVTFGLMMSCLERPEDAGV